MSLVVAGLNHRTSPVELRERLAFPAASLPQALLRLRRMASGAGAVILSTCNRVEFYLHHAVPAEELFQAVRAFLSQWHGVAESEFEHALYERDGREAAGHLFRVASSLDSLVVGEVQILGQVHDAYLAALSEQASDKVLNALFQRAFSVAKRIRSQTSIGAGKVSVSSVAVDLAASIFTGLEGKTVLVVGSGETAELTLRSLVERGAGRVLIANRNPERANAVAEVYGGRPVPFDGLARFLPEADIVISATAAPRFVLYPADFAAALRQRRQAPMFVIDIAVPRDVDPAAGRLDNVYLYDIDDLEYVVSQNVEVRRKEVETCMALVDQEVDQFMGWIDGLAAEPTIVSMAEELHAIRERELEKTLAALPGLSDKQRQEITRLTERIVRAILQRPMKHIKQEIGHHDPGTVIHLVKRLFGIEES